MWLGFAQQEQEQQPGLLRANVRITTPPLEHGTRAEISPCRLVLQRLDFAAVATKGGGRGVPPSFPDPPRREA